MSIDNGDLPAMPYKFDIGGGFKQCAEGLTKREMFAMAAMQGLLTHYGTERQISSAAVDYADGLLAELERTK